MKPCFEDCRVQDQRIKILHDTSFPSHIEIISEISWLKNKSHIIWRTCYHSYPLLCHVNLNVQFLLSWFSDMHSLQDYSKYVPVCLPLPFHNAVMWIFTPLSSDPFINLLRINALAIYKTQRIIVLTWILLDFTMPQHFIQGLDHNKYNYLIIYDVSHRDTSIQNFCTKTKKKSVF